MNRKTSKRSALNKLSLVARSEGMGIDELEKFCAENGVSFSELQSRRDLSLSAMENSGDGNVMSVKPHEDEVACRSRSAPDSSKKTSDILGREK